MTWISFKACRGDRGGFGQRPASSNDPGKGVAQGQSTLERNCRRLAKRPRLKNIFAGAARLSARMTRQGSYGKIGEVIRAASFLDTAARPRPWTGLKTEDVANSHTR